MEIGDIVVVINTSSLPPMYLGQYGKITGLGPKVTVEFVQRIGTRGSMSHTSFASDLIVVGKSSSL